MKILMVVHVGETLGHLLRALPIADALELAGCKVEIATSQRGCQVVASRSPHVRCHVLPWRWSHNEYRATGNDLIAPVSETVGTLISLVGSTNPDAMLGWPGLVSTQVGRSLAIPHLSIMHGPYLSPLFEIMDLTATESAVIESAQQMCFGAANALFEVLHRRFGLSELDYSHFLDTERILAAQDGRFLKAPPNLSIIGFITSSIGRNPQTLPPRPSCYISFGTGNPCELSHIHELAKNVFRNVAGDSNVRIRSNRSDISRFTNHELLARHTDWLICHGGIGTLATFARHGIPMLILPTELDQAVSAVLFARLTGALTAGLDRWAEGLSLGRKLPPTTDSELLTSMQHLSAMTHEPAPLHFATSDGVLAAILDKASLSAFR